MRAPALGQPELCLSSAHGNLTYEKEGKGHTQGFNETQLWSDLHANAASDLFIYYFIYLFLD